MLRLHGMRRFRELLPSKLRASKLSSKIENVAQRNEWLRDISRTPASDLHALDAGHVRGPVLVYTLVALGDRLQEERIRMGVIIALTVGRNILYSQDSQDGTAWSVGHPLTMMAVAFADKCQVDPMEMLRVAASGKRLKAAAWW